MSETTAETCPGCGVIHHGLSADREMWYCETADCSVVLFGPRGLSDTTEEDKEDYQEI